MINKLALVFIVLMFLLSVASASDFRLFRDEKGNWIVQFLDPDEPGKCHTISIKLNGHIWKKEASAYDKTEFNTHKNTTEPPVVTIEEYE